MPDDELLVRARLQNELSAGLRTIQGDLARTTRTAEALAAGTGKAGGGLSDLESKRRAGSAGLRALDSDLQGVSSSLTSTFTSGLKTAGTALGILTGGIAAFGLKSASQFQQSNIAFDALLGSVSAGNDLFKQLQQINLTTPFQLKDIAPATQLLLRYGVAVDKVVPVLKSLLDAAALSGDPTGNLPQVAQALGEVVSIGTLQGRQIRQLQVGGVDALGAVAAQMGITTAAARKLSEAGKISSDQVLNALITYQGPLAKLQGGAAKLSGTLVGQLSNMWDAINIGLADAAKPLTALLTRQIKPITALLKTAVAEVGPPIFNLVGGLATGLSKILPAAAPLLATIVSQFDRLATVSGPLIVNALGPLSGQIGDALVQLVTALVPQMPDLVRLFIALVGVLPAFIKLLTAMVPLIDPVVKLVTAMLGFGPVRDLVAGLLVALLAYNRVSTTIKFLRDLSLAFHIVGNSAETAGVQAGIAWGNLARLAAGGASIPLLTSSAPNVFRGNSTLGQDAEFIGGAGLAGFAVAGPVGAAVGAGGAAVVDVGTHLLHHFTGDPVVPGPTMNAHRAAAAGNPSLRITSGMRNFGLRSPASGHARGTAVDVAGSGLVGYVQRARAGGAWGTIENHGGALHAHVDYGDAAPASGSTAGMTRWTGGGNHTYSIVVNIGRADSQIDVQRAFERALAKTEAIRRQRAYDPVDGRAVVA